MKKQLLYIIPIVIISVSLFGCKKQLEKDKGKLSIASLQSTLDPISDFFQTMEVQTSGQFSLKSYTTLASQNLPCTSTQFHGGYDKNGNRICVSLQTGGVDDRPGATSSTKWTRFLKEVPCDDCYDPSQNLEVWGQDILLLTDATTFGSTAEVEFYVPTKVLISSPSFESGGQIIAANDGMSWNADAENPKGDVIYIVYNPNFMKNLDLAANGYPDIITKGIPLENSGNYTFTATDFADFPDGAYIDISVNRYNFGIFNNATTEEDYLMVAGSTVSRVFELDKNQN